MYVCSVTAIRHVPDGLVNVCLPIFSFSCFSVSRLEARAGGHLLIMQLHMARGIYIDICYRKFIFVFCLITGDMGCRIYVS
jgi:hypothetical protein